MSKHRHFQDSGPFCGASVVSGVGRLATQLRWFVAENLKALKRLRIKARIDGDVDETGRMGNVSRHATMLLANNATRSERVSRKAAARITPLRSAASNLTPAENAQPTDDFNGENSCKFDRHAPATTRSQLFGNLCAIGNRGELSRASAHERARLTIVRRGMQMFRDSANDGLLLCDWLFHQKPREHRGGGFVEPLFEEGINFLFQI